MKFCKKLLSFLLVATALIFSLPTNTSAMITSTTEHYVSEIFETAPRETYSYRGDENLWNYLREQYKTVTISKPPELFEQELRSSVCSIMDITGFEFKIPTDCVYKKEFYCGHSREKLWERCSCDMISISWWRYTGIPTLVDRYTQLYEQTTTTPKKAAVLPRGSSTSPLPSAGSRHEVIIPIALANTPGGVDIWVRLFGQAMAGYTITVDDVNHYIVPYLFSPGIGNSKFHNYRYGQLTDEQLGALQKAFDSLENTDNFSEWMVCDDVRLSGVSTEIVRHPHLETYIRGVKDCAKDIADLLAPIHTRYTRYTRYTGYTGYTGYTRF